ncbi:MAG: metallophosphoesterase [Chloroflexi bacterium]|nr:metallophosphoesterase [Chloroflexota bacterium]
MTFTFIQISDHHLPADEGLLKFGFSPWVAFRATLRHIAAHHAAGADSLVSTGDLVDTGTDAEYAAARRALGLETRTPPPGPQALGFDGLQGLPAYFLPGNHDPRETFSRNMYGEAGTQAGGSETRLYNHVFDHRGVQFVCIDFGAENQAVVYPQTVAFLADALRAAGPSIILTHHQVVPSGIARLDQFLPADPAPLARALRGRAVLGIFCGHFHLSYEGRFAGVPVFGTRSTTHSFADAGGGRMHYIIGNPHYRVVTVGDERVSTQIVEVPL